MIRGQAPPNIIPRTATAIAVMCFAIDVLSLTLTVDGQILRLSIVLVCTNTI